MSHFFVFFRRFGIFKSCTCRFKSIIEQSVTCQYRHSLTVYDMSGLSAASVLIIIHGGQIIMHKRIVMYHFDCRHKRGDNTFGFFRTAKHFPCFRHQHRTQSFTTCQRRIIHRFDDSLLKSFFFRQEGFQDFLHLHCFFF